MNQRNYQKELEEVLAKIGQGGSEKVPTLFLHSCCGPCSSYCMEYLAPHFAITVFYYNPNISASEEYRHRVAEQKRLIEIYNQEKKGHPISFIEGDYRPADFYEAVKGFENCPEGGERCFRCYELRLRETALQAKKRGFDYFGTTLTISPLKNAAKLNEIGERLQREMVSDRDAATDAGVTEAGVGVTDGAGTKVKDRVVDAGVTDGAGTKVNDRIVDAGGTDGAGTKVKDHIVDAGGTDGCSLAAVPAWLPSDFKKKNGYKRSIELSSMFCLYRQDFCGCSFSKAQREREKESRMNQ